MHHCAHLMPIHEPMWVKSGDDPPPCLLPEGHKGEHLFFTSQGKFGSWETDEEYCKPLSECECYQEDGLIECFSSGEIPAAKAVQMLSKVPYLLQPLLRKAEPRIAPDPAQLALWSYY